MDINRQIVIWCGNAPNHKALAHKLNSHFSIAGIVIDNKNKQTPNLKNKSFFEKAFEYLVFKKINDAWNKLQNYYKDKFNQWPDVPLAIVDNINCPEAKRFTEALNPHIIIVSGTGLVKEEMLSIPVEIGILNLHTGLSPYIKGGPNCTNWCIANNDWHLVGNTIMWINKGIDSGNIITSETIDIKECNSLYQAHLAVMEHAHDLYIRAIRFILKASPPYISVPQNHLDKGKLYLTKMWNRKNKKLLLSNWRNRKNITISENKPQTITLPEEKNF